MKLVVWHVGGGGSDLGPVEEILKLPGLSFELFLFELRSPEESKVASVIQESNHQNCVTKVISVGLAGKSEIRDFYLNKFELSSSLLSASSLTKIENPGFSKWGGIYKSMKTWDENTQLSRLQKVRVATINEIVESGVAPAPDILSMDIQGLELEVLLSSQNYMKNLVAVITESEFFEIYSKQGLLHEQLSLLGDASFRFVKFFGFQKWYPGPMVGSGFTTVTESLFIKFLVRPEQNKDTDRKHHLFDEYDSQKLLQIAFVAFAYKRFSYFFTLIQVLESRNDGVWVLFQEAVSLKPYLIFYNRIRNKLETARVNPNYFVDANLQNSSYKNSFYRILVWLGDRLVKFFKIRGIVFRIDKFKGQDSPFE